MAPFNRKVASALNMGIPPLSLASYMLGTQCSERNRLHGINRLVDSSESTPPGSKSKWYRPRFLGTKYGVADVVRIGMNQVVQILLGTD